MNVREERMRTIVVKAPGNADSMHVVEISRPAPKPGEVLIKVAAAGVNRADIVQLHIVEPTFGVLIDFAHEF